MAGSRKTSQVTPSEGAPAWLSGNCSDMDAHRMAQNRSIRNEEFKFQNESLKSPSTGPNFKSSLPEEDKTSKLPNNFSICEQANMFFETRSSNSSESSYDGCHGSFNRQRTTSEMNGGELRVFVSYEPAQVIPRSFTTHHPPTQAPLLKLSCAEGKSEAMNGASTFLPSSANEINPVHASALQHAKQRKLQSSPDNTLSTGCDQLHRSTCNFCRMFGSLRCARCKQIYYCSVECQRKDWQMHSVVCRLVKHNADKVEDNAKSLDEIKKKENLSEEQSKKTIYSDLTTLELKKNMKIVGTVTQFNNPSEFYIQVKSPEVLSNINKLSVKLKDYDGINQDEYIPAKGEVSVGQYTLDQAIKCCVANVLPTEEKWNANISQAIAPFLIGKCCSFTVVDVLVDEMPYFAVDVVLADSGKNLREILLEIGCSLNSKSRSSAHKENSVTGSTVEKISIQKKKLEHKGLDHSGCQTRKVILPSIGDTFLGMVAHIQTPGDFFCQQMGNGCKLTELQVSLGEYCDTISATPDFCPAVGDLCCAQFTEDKQWYRASVLSCISEKTALVGYVDYGNTEVLPLNKLRPIIPKFMELPVQAIKCTLAGVKPVSGTWSLESTSVMKKLVQNKVLTIRVINEKDKTFVVKLTDESRTPTINVSKYLLELECAVEEATTASAVLETSIGTLQKMSGQQLDKIDWSRVTLTDKQVVNVFVCVLYNPSKFYCQLLDNNGLNALEELNISLAAYCNKTAPTISKVTKGDVCCAYFSGDGRWYRALVEEASSFETFKVLFVDYGNCEEVTLDKIRQITSTFMKLPFQAIECSLSGVRPINKEWTAEATTTLQTFIAGKKTQARVVSLTTNGAEVELIDNSESGPIVISEYLIKNNLALKKEIVLDLNVQPGELTDSDSQGCIQWTTTEFLVGQTLPVHVLDVTNPGLFYAVPTKMKVDQQRLRKLMTGLVDYCNSQNDSSFKPKVGEPCCARFTGDDNWYRAVVLEVCVSEVKVAYADYGNVEMLPLSRLLPITAPYLELPFQILKCSIAGIMELDGKCSTLAAEKLKSFLMNECVTITVKGVNKNIHIVTVKKESGTHTMNVADELVIENSAKDSNIENRCVKNTKCCCMELRKQVTKLEQIIYFLLKDRFGEEKVPEMIKLFEEAVLE
ncbi:tudor domain-containing protein 1 isoform X2 [Lacerta agilis]|uniref:tudor domain-containing protein 1 isoform X2 n=1 Tax=Lacerta agilis TaxID=80427 RepID=UPI00141A1E1E|nr:tudor domain-containing protein 1 isoform X2 [Lacerta agilis]